MKQIYCIGNGWSDWQTPHTSGKYRLGCCDCGLTHNFQFRVIHSKPNRILDNRKFLVQFRVKKNSISTSNIRHKPQKCQPVHENT